MSASTTTSSPARVSRPSLSGHMNEIGLIAIVAMLYVVFGAISPGFLSANNQVNILRDGATIGIAAWAQTLVIVAGEIDISVGPMVAFISVIMAFLLKWHLPLPVALAGGLVLGSALGGFAGLLRAVFTVPSFVATLGLWSALRGLALFMTNALPISFGDNDTLDWIGGNLFGLPVSAIVMFVLFGAFVFASRKTAFGRSVYAVGGNANAAHLCGINVTRIRIMVFAVSGLMAAITAIMLLARLGTGNAGAASGLEFDVIAAVVVGGTSLSGGRGSMLGTLLGVLTITVISDGLVLYGINSFVQDVVRGVIIVAAVLLNVAAARRSGRLG